MIDVISAAVEAYRELATARWEREANNIKGRMSRDEFDVILRRVDAAYERLQQCETAMRDAAMNERERRVREMGK